MAGYERIEVQGRRIELCRGRHDLFVLAKSSPAFTGLAANGVAAFTPI